MTHKISYKVTFGVLLILSVSLFLLGFLIISDLRQQMTHNLMVQGEQLSSFLAKTSIEPIKNYRFYFLREYALKLEQFSQVAYCEIYNRDGDSLIDMESTYTEKPIKNKAFLSDEILIIKKTIEDKNTIYGHIEIGLYLNEVESEIRKRTYHLSFLFLAILAGVAILLRWFLSALLVTPVITLSNIARNLAVGNFKDHIYSDRKDEIGGLINNFDVMRKNLKSSFDEVKSKNQAIQIKNDKLIKIDSEIKNLNKNLEDKVEVRTLKLKKSLQELSETQNKLIEIEKMASLGRLVSGVAHEINTPIGVCITALSHTSSETDTLRKHFDQEVLSRIELENYLDGQIEANQMIQDNLDRAANLVKSFKSVSVEQSSNLPVKFSLKEAIDVILDKYRDEYSRISLTLNCDKRLVIISYLDAFTKIIENMLLNSFQHGFENANKGSIEINVSVNGGHLCLNYVDNGKGMNDESVNNIFEPFYTTKRGVGGTGLGMHIVYNLVTQKLKGDITCQSEPTKGISITIRIPTTAPQF